MPEQSASPRSGNLRIGDQWNAITIIARSQTHPLKAVCELVENAIDAHATDVHIVRRHKQGRTYLELWDDGNGVKLDDNGDPDFHRIATHVCDSMKRHLDAADRTGVHGEFGIGLLSFWSLGEELLIASPGKGGALQEMALQRGQRQYTIRPVRGELPSGGTRVIVGPLLDATRTIVTGEKLQRYLAAELRDRIRNTGVHIHITDRVSRKQFVVVPREFDGDRLELPTLLPAAQADIQVELYIRATPGGPDSGVAVCKDGTRVLRHLTELDPLDHAPWTDGRLEGVFDFPAFNLAPGTRSGIVPDECLDAFVSAVRELEPAVLAAVEQWDQAESDKASRQILKQVHKAFVHALRELPANEYLFFDLPEEHPGPQAGGRASGDALTAAARSTSGTPGEAEPVLFPPEPGPLAVVAIRPQTARRNLGENCLLSATACDADGVPVPDGVEFHWQIVEGDGTFVELDGPRARVTSQQVGRLSVQVTAKQDDIEVSAGATVKYFDGSEEEHDKNRGLPSYRLEAVRGAAWRSRYDLPLNEIVINSSHRDFLASKQTAAKHRRYIGKLYAKEVVLINFPHESAAEVMERLIEVMLRTEDAL
jgi:hypothetical protein